MEEKKIIDAILETGRRLWQKNFVAANDGNISFRLNDSEILCTPSGISKGFMSPEMIVKIDLQGNLLQGNYKPSSEIKMHLEAYKQRPDIKAVVHAHPVYAVSLSVTGQALDTCLLPEIVVCLGEVPLAPYATPSTEEVPQSISKLIKNHNALLLENQGVLTVGRDLDEAYFNMETVEHASHVYFNALQIKNIRYLTKTEVDKLIQIRKKFGLSEDIPVGKIMRNRPKN